MQNNISKQLFDDEKSFRFSKFLEDTYGYSRKKAANVNAILYVTSIVLCPVVGQINVSVRPFFCQKRREKKKHNSNKTLYYKSKK